MNMIPKPLSLKLDRIQIVIQIKSATHYPTTSNPNLINDLINNWLEHNSVDFIVDNMQFYYAYYAVHIGNWENATLELINNKQPNWHSISLKENPEVKFKGGIEGTYKLSFFADNTEMDTFEDLCRCKRKLKTLVPTLIGEKQQDTAIPKRIDPSLFRF